MRYVILITSILLLLAGCSSQNEGTFPQNNISIVIPYGPGGGFDTTVRVFAPYFARQFDGEITVLPENQPGAGGRRGSAYVYRADPDGYTLGIFNLPGFVLPSILGERVDYELRELSWIGRIESQTYVLVVAANSDIHSLDDLKALDQISFVSTGYGSTVLAAMQIAADVLGLMEKDPIFLAGYPGTADYLVGLIRGDGNVALVPPSSAGNYIESGDLRVLAITGERSPFEGVPTFAELGYPELTSLDLQRSLAGPPNMDPELLATLREAFGRAISDPEFLAAASKARMDVSPLTGDETAAEVDASFNFYERYKANLKNPNAM
jgi:tripartite-type tricarboxylate transporter receptor subunit TctC